MGSIEVIRWKNQRATPSGKKPNLSQHVHFVVVGGGVVGVVVVVSGGLAKTKR